ncbi:unnamed protein product [Clonostachys chloroleuca]|uniref:Uncharacterized protein n=1 Tax=Clonostachys chloroleuca TaxID=1926264 RepID=A0AA35Q7U8_9HYPO|nr:unnamed protein product [Clonostachys chloroleuca]
MSQTTPISVDHGLDHETIMPPDQLDEKGDGLEIITASMFRMGTSSMSEAFKILGYNPHHGLDDSRKIPWVQIEEAAEGKWPSTSDASGVRRRRRSGKYTRQEWDAVWHEYDAVTDIAAPFASDLATLYPEARVIVIQRDFYSWWPSFLTINLGWRFFWGAELITTLLGIFNMRAGHAVRKLYFGLFQAHSIDELQANARRGYEDYFAEIRRVVPESRRLEYRLGSGWEPLCKFLGKEVPDVPFPKVNDGAELEAWLFNAFVDAIMQTLIIPLLYGTAVVAVLYLSWSLYGKAMR